MIALAVLVLASAVSVRAALVVTARARTRRRVGDVDPIGSPMSLLRRLAAPVVESRAQRTMERDLPNALDAVARSLRSGSSLRQAIDEASGSVGGVLGHDLASLRHALRDGDPLEDALARWAVARPLSGVRLAVAALSLGAETGGASARAVDGVAATLRTNLAIAAEVRALSSQARLSALVIALAPIAFSFLAFTTDASTAAFLLRTPLGLACLVTGLGLDAIGWLWMRRLTASVA